MDPYEATRIVYGRVQALEPEVGSKIMLHLLLQEHGEQEMLRLALGSDALVQAMVGKAKKELGLGSLGSLGEDTVPVAGGLRGGGGGGVREQQQQQQQARPAPLYIPDHDFGSFSNVLSSPSLHEVKLAAALQQQQQQQQHSHSHSHTHEQQQQQLFLHDQLPLHDHLALLSDAVEQSSLRGGGMYAAVAAASDHFYPETYAFLNSSKELLHSRSSSSRASPVVDNINIINNNGSSPPDLGPALAWKPCLYFARGYCKHGSNCRFLHGPMRESSGSPASSNGNGGRELRVDDNGMAPGSLERLEIELQELLRGRRAPVSIASLPQLYYERFGKTLQAEGYLTESQRHGKAGYSLTKLLARLKNTVTLIDRYALSSLKFSVVIGTTILLWHRHHRILELLIIIISLRSITLRSTVFHSAVTSWHPRPPSSIVCVDGIFRLKTLPSFQIQLKSWSPTLRWTFCAHCLTV